MISLNTSVNFETSVSLEKVILKPSYYDNSHVTHVSRNNEKVVAPVKFPEIFKIYVSFS